MLKTKTNNRLLYSGAVIFFCTSIIYIIISTQSPDILPDNDKFGSFDNVFLIILSTLLIAPIFEEIIFRGIFTKRKFFTYYFYIGSLLMIAITKNYYLIALLILIFIIRLGKFKESFTSYCLIAFLFALMHYGLDDFSNLYSFIPVFFQFSIGLILTWIVINFGIKWSILSHFTINFTIIASVIFVLQFPDKEKHFIENENNELNWEKTSILGKSNIVFSENRVEAERVTIEKFLKTFNNQAVRNIKINDTLKLYRFNFKIESKNNIKLKENEINELFLKAKLIE